MKDFYKILELESTSSIIKIKRAYRQLALKLHPDVNSSPSAHEQFIAVNEAYQVLHNPIKRKEYDRLYTVLILNKKPSNPQYYQKKSTKWENDINTQATKGREKGEKYEGQPPRKFKRKFNFFNFWLFDIIMQIVFEAVFMAVRIIFN